MRARARLTVRCRDAGTARLLEDVLTPDNLGVPRGQRFTMSRSGGTLSFQVDSERLSSLISTALSVLADASLFQEVWLLSRGRDASVGRRP